MRHGNKVNNLGRKSAHRKAMLSNMACSLIQHKRITTTIAKAKALRGFVEPLLTKSKSDSTHSRRTVFSYLQNKDVVTELFREIAPKIAERQGGYTRIIRTGYRLGDNAEMCMIELVDFNEIYTNEKAKKTTRRSRRSGGAKKDVETTTSISDAEVVESVDEEVADEANETAEVTEDLQEIEAEVEKTDAPVAEANEESSVQAVEEASEETSSEEPTDSPDEENKEEK
jgi:large subunit ribosomal protein L17